MPAPLEPESTDEELNDEGAFGAELAATETPGDDTDDFGIDPEIASAPIPTGKDWSQVSQTDFDAAVANAGREQPPAEGDEKMNAAPTADILAAADAATGAPEPPAQTITIPEAEKQALEAFLGRPVTPGDAVINVDQRAQLTEWGGLLKAEAARAREEGPPADPQGAVDPGVAEIQSMASDQFAALVEAAKRGDTGDDLYIADGLSTSDFRRAAKRLLASND